MKLTIKQIDLHIESNFELTILFITVIIVSLIIFKGKK